MNDFINFCNALSPLTDGAEDELRSVLKYQTVSKNEYLLKSGRYCERLYFIRSGLVKVFFENENRVFIMRFFAEESMMTALGSFLSGEVSAYHILAIERTELSYIEKTDLEALCESHHCMERFFRKLLGSASINLTRRVSDMLEEDATAHYHSFVKENQSLLQRVSLGDVASYLGISQVTLSRIRAKG